eukprot:4427791-Pleurochrysis_carterae.AAC.5
MQSDKAEAGEFGYFRPSSESSDPYCLVRISLAERHTPSERSALPLYAISRNGVVISDVDGSSEFRELADWQTEAR